MNPERGKPPGSHRIAGDLRRLFVPVSKASLAFCAACVCLALLGFVILGMVPAAPGSDALADAAGAFALILPAVGAGMWARRMLCQHFAEIEARAVAKMAGISSPLALIAGSVVGMIAGSWAGNLGSAFAVVVVFIATATSAVALSCGSAAFALWITRRSENPHLL